MHSRHCWIWHKVEQMFAKEVCTMKGIKIAESIWILYGVLGWSNRQTLFSSLLARLLRSGRSVPQTSLSSLNSLFSELCERILSFFFRSNIFVFFHLLQFLFLASPFLHSLILSFKGFPSFNFLISEFFLSFLFFFKWLLFLDSYIIILTFLIFHSFFFLLKFFLILISSIHFLSFILFNILFLFSFLRFNILFLSVSVISNFLSFFSFFFFLFIISCSFSNFLLFYSFISFY